MAAFKEEQKLASDRRAREAAREATVAEQRRQSRRRENGARVTYRIGKRQEAAAHAQQLRWESQVKEARRLEAIARIAASVPYAAALENLVANPLKPTVAAQAWGAEAHFDRSHFRTDPNAINKGYSDAKLFSNPAFKLGYALREAGVNRSAASAAAIKAMCPITKAPY